MFELNRERRKNGNSEKLSKGNEKRRWNWGNCKQFVDDVDEIFFMITIISSTESCVRLENIIWEKNIFCWNIPSEPLTVAIRFHISLLFTFFFASIHFSRFLWSTSMLLQWTHVSTELRWTSQSSSFGIGMFCFYTLPTEFTCAYNGIGQEYFSRQYFFFFCSVGMQQRHTSVWCEKIK